MASFMPPAYIRSVRGSQGADLKTPVGKIWAEEELGGAPSNGPNEAPTNEAQNANDHEQQARVHPAQPSYSVVVPAPEL